VLDAGIYVVKIANAFGLLALACFSVSVARADWAPCGGAQDKLWSWAWAGESGEYVTTIGGSRKSITDMQDLSGNGHHYFNHTGSKLPAFQAGLSVGDYKTNLPVVALDRYEDGTQVYSQWMEQAGLMSANGPFYLAFAGMNTRGRGHRHLWGTSWNDLVRIEQGRNRVDIIIDGTGYLLSEDGTIPNGAILLEIWRNEDDLLNAWVNGIDISRSGVKSSAVFNMTGIGWSGDGSSGWDDYAFEYIACNALPDYQQRSEVREYLRAKWGIYGQEVVPPAVPNAPTEVKVD
jgi:hypothetical protein